MNTLTFMSKYGGMLFIIFALLWITACGQSNSRDIYICGMPEAGAKAFTDRAGSRAF
jgi:hypothetical protein